MPSSSHWKIHGKIRVLELIKRLPVDLGQSWYRHTTKAKLIAFSFVGEGGRRKALDLGCGDGFWSEKLRAQGWDVTSADRSNKRYPRAQIVDAEKPLPYPDCFFDLVWLAEVIEHIKNLDGLVRELRRVTKPGGRLILTTPNSAFWLYGLLRQFNITPQEIQNPDHKHFFSLADIRRLFPRAEIYGFFPYALFKFTIRKAVGVLSPTFVIVERQ
jgi:SAM-dependent methyltransferase